MKLRRLGSALVSTVLVLAGSGLLIAQTHFASFTGTVTSKDGVPCRCRSRRDEPRDAGHLHGESNSDGLYTISALPIGTYKVRAQAQGFQAFETNAIRLESGQIARVDITMQLGVEQQRRGHRRDAHPPDPGRRRR